MRKIFSYALIIAILASFILPLSVSAAFQHESKDITSDATRVFNLNGKYRSSTQGMCVADHYLVVTRWSSNSKPTTYVVLDLETGKEVGHYDFSTGHSNSMAYNAAKNEIAVVTDGKAYLFDFSDGVMRKKESISVGNHAVKVAYVADKESYYISTGIRMFRTKDFRTLTETFRSSELATNQGMGSDGTNLFVCWWGSSKNTIEVLSTGGKKVTSYTLDDAVCDEVEEVDFYKGNMYLNITNSGSNNGIYVVAGDGNEKVAEQQAETETKAKTTENTKEEASATPEEQQEQEEAAHIHEYSDWVVTKEATCAEDGQKERTCACGEKQIETIPATGQHKEGPWEQVTEETCEQEGLKQKFCQVCGAVLDEQVVQPTGHDYGEWRMSKNPTVFVNSEYVRTCKVCGLEELKNGEPLEPYLILDASLVTAWYKDPTKLQAVVNEGDTIVSWTSSDKKVASVSQNGTVTPHRPGKASITVKTKSGLKKTCKVTVKWIQLD